MSRRRALVLGWALATLGVAGVGGAQTSPTPAPTAPSTPSKVVTAVDSMGRLEIRREDFTYERRGRRDPFASLIASGEIRPLFADLRVTAILVDPAGSNSVAMLKDVSTNQLYKAKVGSVFGRIRVTAIRAKEVAVAIDEFGNTRQEVLMLKDGRKERAP